MRLRMIQLILCLLMTSQAQAEFQIDPYLNFSDNNHAYLNLQSSSENKITIKIESEIPNSFFPTNKESENIIQNSDFQKIDLGTLKCDQQVIYTIQNESNETLTSSKLPGFPCDKKKDLYFGFMSDSQTKTPAGLKRAIKVSETITELKKEFPINVIVNSGDVVQIGGNHGDWKNYFSLARNYLKDTYVFAAVGNHDYFESPAYDKAPAPFLNYLRDEKGSDLGYAELNLKKIKVLMLNSNFDQMSESKLNEQWQWLENKLIENQSKNIPVLVSMHHAPYSSSADYVRPNAKLLRNKLVPLLEKYSCVKMMLAGHLHMYERSQKGNLTYLNAGPTGGIINYITYKNPYKTFIKPFVTTFSVFKVTNNLIEVTTYTGQKEIIDQFSVKL